MANPLGAHTIFWHEGEPAGFTGILPAEWFKDEGSLSEVRHAVEGPRSGATAKCNVNVRNNVAILDYRPFGKENEEQGMLLGVLRLSFMSSSREAIAKCNGRTRGNEAFRIARQLSVFGSLPRFR